MKNMFVVLAILASLMVSSVALAQGTSGKVYSVPESMLTETQKAQLKAQEVQSTVETSVETAGKYAGIGREVGAAFREILSAANEESNKFANTKVGVFAMVLIAWKIMGTDALQLVGGTFFALIWLPIWIIAFFRIALPRRVLAQVSAEGAKTYETIDPAGEYYPLWFWLIFLVMVGLNALIVFPKNAYIHTASKEAVFSTIFP